MLDFLTAYLVKPLMEKQFSYNLNTEIDRYVASKNPQNIAEVEHWEKEYMRKQNRGWSL
jgi:5S rRNA maturation endonuclease (ribonuclease M5)